MVGAHPTGGHPVQVSPAEAKELLDADAAILVDVREDHELQQARVEGALHIPLMQLGARADEVPKDTTVVMMCHVGQRSLHAVHLLRNMGYTDVLNLQGGIVAWYQQGLPVKTGDE